MIFVDFCVTTWPELITKLVNVKGVRQRQNIGHTFKRREKWALQN